MTALMDQHTLTVSVNGERAAPVSAQVTLDASWSPYMQGDILIEDPGIPELWNPRTRPTVTLIAGRRYAGSDTLGEFSTDHAALTLGTLSTMYSGQTLSQLSSPYRTDWNTVARQNQRARFTGIIRRANRGIGDGVISLEFASPEILLQDYKLAAADQITPAGTTIRPVVQAVLNRAIGASLTPGDVDATLGIGDDHEPITIAPPWSPGVSAWDYLTPIVQAAGLRFYADELGAWHLIAEETKRPGLIVLQTQVTEAEEETTTTSDYYDSAVLVYEWEDTLGNPLKEIDYFESPGATRTYVETIRGKMTRRGRAERIVKRSLERGRSMTVRNVSQYDARPTMQTQSSLASGHLEQAAIDQVAWKWPDAEMSLKLQGVIYISPFAWSALSPGRRWIDEPIGGTWADETLGEE